MNLYFVDFERKKLLEKIEVAPGTKLQVFEPSETGLLIRTVYPTIFDNGAAGMSKQEFDNEIAAGNFPLLTEAKLITSKGRDFVTVTVTGIKEDSSQSVMIDTEVFEELICAYMDETDQEIN